MALYYNNTLINQETQRVYVGGASQDKVYYNNTLVWRRQKTVQTYADYNSSGNTYTMNWFNNSASGWNYVSLSAQIVGSENIFFVGLSTQPASGAVSDAAPAGSIWNQKSVNGSNSNSWSTGFAISSGTTYYVYVGTYYATTSGYANIVCTFMNT